MNLLKRGKNVVSQGQNTWIELKKDFMDSPSLKLNQMKVFLIIESYSSFFHGLSDDIP